MQPRYLVTLCVVFLFIPFCVLAQEIPDSANFYKRLEKRSDKHNFTRWVHDAIFSNSDDVEKDTPVFTSKKKTVNPFLKYKGKIVRNINIVVLDPFGYSVNDLFGKTQDYFDRIGNKYHVTTKERIVRNLLLFKTDNELDPLEVSESERLLRLSPFLYDARIYIQKYKYRKGDSVDVLVVVQDNWSTLASTNFDISSPQIKVTEKNFLGLGHQMEEGISWSSTDQYLATTGKYSIFNIRKTFISTAAFYSTAKDNKQFGVAVDRPFYSPLAKWAGGISVVKNNTVFLQPDIETGLINKYALNYNASDVWGAKSFPLTQNKSADIKLRSSNFIWGARYYRVDYTERPSFEIDINKVIQDKKLYLTNFGFTRRSYYRDRYLFRYGANEDIPEGVSCELILGAMKNELSSLWYYSGVKFGAGKHFDKYGYLSAGVGYGTFYNKDFIGSGVVNFNAIWFADLVKMNRWYFRQFCRFKLVEGIDRALNENLNINGAQMYGFSSDLLMAKSKIILSFEFVLYAPYKLIGFQFAPVLFCGFAGMGKNFGSMFGSQVYQSYALGVLIRNEYLVSSTFQISIGLYPYMPGNSDFTLKFNPITNYDVRARDYFISKPDIVSYD